MGHPSHCERAKGPVSECTCRCGGKLHGVQKLVEDFAKNIDEEEVEIEMEIFEELPQSPEPPEETEELPPVGDVL